MATLRVRVLGVIAAGLLAAAFAAPLQAQNCGPMDVVFIIDNSGSMTGVINEVQGQVQKIADAVVAASGGDYQFGLVAMPANDVAVYLDLAANNRADLDTAVSRMATVSSCGLGIAYDEALDTVLNHLGPRTGGTGQQTGAFAGQWRPNAAKIIMIITDTGPQGFDCDPGTHGSHAHDMAALAASMNVHITGIFVPDGGGTDPATDIPILQDVAATSGGLFKETQPDASDTADVIIDIVNACGGAAGAGSVFLIVDPTEISLSNLESADVNVTNFLPPKADSNLTTTFSASGLPEDSAVTFSQRTPDTALTEARTMHVSIGPDTPAGTYVLTVKASREDISDLFNYVLVFVDCVPPFLLGTNNLNSQSQSVPSGTTAKLQVVPSGNGPFKYQWYQGHSGSTAFPVAGATTSQFTTPAITTPTEFWVRISNACGSRDSATAVVSPR